MGEYSFAIGGWFSGLLTFFQLIETLFKPLATGESI
jgi:hypothetical protein